MGAQILLICLGILILMGLVWLFPLEIQFSFWKDWSRTEVTIEMGPPPWLGRMKWARFYRKWIIGEIIGEIKDSIEKGDLENLTNESKKPTSDLAEIRTKLREIAEYTKGVGKLIDNKRIKRFRRLRWISEIGLFNAMETALAVGFFWAVKGCVMSGIQQRTGLPVPNPEIGVLPNFQRSGWRMEFICIFESRLGEMLLDGWSLSRFRRSKKK